MKKKVLIVSDNFGWGGLETQIINQVRALRDKVDFVFCFGEYTERDGLEGCKVYANIGEFLSLRDFYSAVKKITEIIKEERVDVVHVHPFYGWVPVMFASVLTGVPVIYTVHGIASLHGIANLNTDVKFVYQFLFKYLLSEMEPSVISVNADFETVLKNACLVKNFYYIANSVEVKKYAKVRQTMNGRWVFAARLEDMREGELLVVMQNMKKFGIKQLDVYGAGGALNRLRSAAKELGVQKKVAFLGWIDGLDKAFLAQEYEGVIGQGQIVLEGLAAGMPVLFASYGRVTGLVDAELFRRIAAVNFINIYEKDVLIEEVGTQMGAFRADPGKYILKDLVISKYGDNEMARKYYEVICCAQFRYSRAVKDVWDKLEALTEADEVALNEEFFNSGTMENLIETCFDVYKVVNPFLLNNLRERIITRVATNKILVEIHDEINKKVQNIGLVGAAKRDIREMRKKVKKVIKRS